jgi:hypothetical protein
VPTGAQTCPASQSDITGGDDGAQARATCVQAAGDAVNVPPLATHAPPVGMGPATVIESARKGTVEQEDAAAWGAPAGVAQASST